MSNLDNSRSPRPMRALIYCRVSADPSGRRVSVESQERENRAFCDREGYEIAAVITDNDRSASRYATKTREGYETVKEALAGKTFGRIDVLVCWESSRAQRGLKDYVVVRDLCHELNVLFAYSGRAYDLRDPHDRLATGLHALMDEQESDKIRQRILRSHRDSAMKGEPRGVTPYGYLRNYDPASGKLLGQAPDPGTAPVVQEIVRRLLAGDTLYVIAKDLNDRGVPTPRQYRDAKLGRDPDTPHRGWGPTQIKHLVRRDSLAGKRTHRGEDVRDAKWPAIVSVGDWQRVQDLLADPARRGPTPRGVAPVHLLSGLATCGVCGAWLRPMRNRSRQTYYCAGLSETTTKGHVSTGQLGLDSLVVTTVVAILSRPDALAELGRREQDGSVETSQAQREVETIQGHLDYYESKAAGMDPERLTRMIVDLEAKLRAAKQRLSPAWVPAAVKEMAGSDASVRWVGSSLHTKRVVTRALVKVVLHTAAPGTRGRRQFDPSRVEIVRLL